MLAARGDRIVRDLPSAVSAALPDALVDVTDTLPGLASATWVRDPKAVVTWAVPSTATARFVTPRTGGRTIEVRSEAVVDPEHAAFGRPLERRDWELWSETDWIGGLRRSRLRFSGAPRATVLPAAIAELGPNPDGKLVVGLGTPVHRAVELGLPSGGAALGSVPALSLPLPALAASGSSRRPAELTLTPVDRPAPADPSVLRGDLVSTWEAVSFEGRGELAAGRYRLDLAPAADPARSRTITVSSRGVVRLLPQSVARTRARAAAGVRRRLAAVLPKALRARLP